jgi:hypothetical protein
MCVPFSVFCVLFVCKCVMCYYHRVAPQLQLKNIPYHIKYLDRLIQVRLGRTGYLPDNLYIATREIYIRTLGSI